VEDLVEVQVVEVEVVADGRDWHGRFVKEHKVPKIWREKFRNVYKGKRFSPITEFKKGNITWNRGKEHFYVKGDKNPMKRPEVRKKVSEKNRIANKLAYLKDPILVKRVLTFRRPNKTEKKLIKIFQKNFPNEFKFVGDGLFVIEGLNPDWVNCNGKKLIIELFGEPWHEKEEAEKRINIFAKYGFKTLIIWWKETRNKKLLIEKVRNFISINSK